MTEAHATINREIAEGLGVEPYIIHIATKDGGKSACANTSRYGPWYTREELAAWLSEQHAAGTHQDYVLAQWKRYPDYINSAEASAELEDELWRRGYVNRICTFADEVSYELWSRHRHAEALVLITTSASAARRLALATCAAKVLKRQEKPNA